METLKTAVIGTGNMGRHHVRVYSELENTELVGIADLDLKRAEELAKQYNTNAYKDYSELLLKEKPDCVSIVVPTAFHAQIGSKVLTKTNALVEKPIAFNEDDAIKIINTAKKNNTKIMIGQIERYNPVIQYLVNNIDKKEFLSFNIMRLGPYTPKSRTTGIIMDMGIHDIDLIRYITKEEPEQVHASCMHVNIKDFEDHAHVFLRTPSVTASLISNWISPLKIRHMYATLKTKFIYLNFITQKVVIYEKNSGIEPKKTEVEVKKEEPLKKELNAFLESIRKNQEPPVTGEDGLKSMRIALRATRNAYESDPNAI
ncbi:Gfo/Idh/MocA family oxidoreductase [archaeon]|nr:Gfo/Idh/MocA family oxidoreductase [archaeon]